jgi:hypothetical protein
MWYFDYIHYKKNNVYKVGNIAFGDLTFHITVYALII